LRVEATNFCAQLGSNLLIASYWQSLGYLFLF
jgi:hypothetical protein